MADNAEQLKAATADMAAAPAPATTPPDEASVAAQLAEHGDGGGVTSVNVDRLLAAISSLQSRVDAMEDEKASQNLPPVVAQAEAARDLLKTHANHNPQTDHSEVLALADDAVDAAGNAVDSGDGTELGKIAARLARAIKRIHPGPGDHHYLNQAQGIVTDHLPESADQLEPRPSRAPAAQVTSDRPPAKVISGSVTG
jgi:hypothetical protein